MALDGTRQTLLRDENGNKLVDRRTPQEVVEAAYKRHVAERDTERTRLATGDIVLVIEVCRAYLTYCQRENKPSTTKCALTCCSTSAPATLLWESNRNRSATARGCFSGRSSAPPACSA